MIAKQTRRFSIVTGIRNAIGYGKRRGGAGAVAAALAACIIVGCLAIPAVGADPQPSDYQDEIPQESPDGTDIVPWEKPAVQDPAPTSYGATPGRLRW